MELRLTADFWFSSSIAMAMFSISPSHGVLFKFAKVFNIT